jgi:hypothetical protein
MKAYPITFDGRVLEGGFWLYVIDIPKKVPDTFRELRV